MMSKTKEVKVHPLSTQYICLPVTEPKIYSAGFIGMQSEIEFSKPLSQYLLYSVAVLIILKHHDKVICKAG